MPVDWKGVGQGQGVKSSQLKVDLIHFVCTSEVNGFVLIMLSSCGSLSFYARVAQDLTGRYHCHWANWPGL